MPYMNKVVVINSADSKIGEVIALSFAKKAVRLSLIGTNQEILKKTTENCEKVTKNKVIFSVINNNSDLKAAVDKTELEYGKIDVIVNCMKDIIKPASINDENLMDNFDETMEGNVKSVVALTHYAVKALESTKGNIINVLSCAANASNVDLDVANALLNSFTKNMALELGPKGIRANAILPWGPPCSSPQAQEDNMQNKFSTIKLVSSKNFGGYLQSPLKISVKATSVADMATYLASDEANSITGASYTINAGAILVK